MEEKVILSAIKDSSKQKISSLFAEARDKLREIDQERDKKKKEAAVELTKSLEGKFQIDIICKEIVDRLNGTASKSLIRECLPEKYKQGYQVKKAKRQKKNHNKEINLAPLLVLNKDEYSRVDVEAKEKQEEKQENKGVILVGIGGREYRQREKDEEPSKISIEKLS
jgi:hypothetical protein